MICVSTANAAATPGIRSESSVESDEPLVTDRPTLLGSTQSDAFQANNTTVEHVDIGAVGDESGASSTGRILAEALGDRLTTGSLYLLERRFDPASQQVGPEFNRTLGQYSQFASGTPGDDDDAVAVRFRRAGDTQRELTADVRTYQSTLMTYRQARRNDNRQQAKEAARKLLRLSREINATGQDLKRSYQGLSETGTVDLTNASEAIDVVVADVSTSQTSVENVTLVPTRLRASANRTNVSARDPLVVTGQLSSSNGTELGNRTIRLRSNNTSVRAQTSSNGSFRLTYRPLLDSTGPTRIRVEYVPLATSKYATSNTTIDVRVRQVEPTLSVDVTPNTARFNDTLAISGTLAVEDYPASSVPVVLSLENRSLARVTTNESGRFEYVAPLPPTVPVGEVRVRAQLPFEDSALSPVNETRPLTVRRTETSLEPVASHLGGRRIGVRGSLTTTSGTTVANQLIVIELDGVEMERVTTDDSGTYNATIEVPSRFLSVNNTSVRIRTTFDASGTNLAGTEGRATVTIPASEARSGLPGDPGWVSTQLGDVSIWTLAPIVGLASLVVAGVYLRRRDRTGLDEGDSPDDTTSATLDTDDETGVSDPTEPVIGEGDEEASLSREDRRLRDGLALAREQLDRGDPDVAVETAYAAFKGYLAAVHDLDRSLPHQEFLTAYESAAATGSTADAYRQFTDLYERAAFAPDRVSSSSADTGVRQMESVLDDEDGANRSRTSETSDSD